MAKSKGRLLAELLASDGKVKESKSALDITGGKLAPSDIPTLPNSKLENSSISIAGHNTALGGSVTLNTGDIGEHTNYKYHTEARVRGSISATGSLSYNSTTGVMSFTMPAQNTSNITEGSNKYYTDARVGSYLSTNGYATQSTIVGAITDSAPATLDTLNELAAALGDDANFSTTVTNSIATKLPLAGGTITGTTKLNDSIALQFGTDGDGSIHHDGSHFRLKATTGNFNIQTNDFHITDKNNTTVRFLVDHDGATSIRYNGVQKLATTSTGIDVTGTVSATNTSAGVTTGLKLYNNTSGANNRVAIDFYTASTKYGTIEGGYGASSPEMNFKVGNTPAQILKLNSAGIDVTGTVNGDAVSINGTTVIDASRALVSINHITSGGDINTTSGGFEINGTTVIDSSRNLTNIGTISSGNITASRFIQNSSTGSNLYAVEFSRSGSGTTTPDIWGTNDTLVIGTSSSVEAVGFSGANAQFYGTISSGAITSTGVITGSQDFKATGSNMKLHAGGNHIINIDLNGNFYPQTHNAVDLGFSDSLAFRNLHLVGAITGGATISSGYIQSSNQIRSTHSGNSPSIWSSTTDGYMQVGPNGGGASGVFGAHRETTGTDALDYTTYIGYDVYYDDGTKKWYANRTNLGRKWKTNFGGYHQNRFSISTYDGGGTTGSSLSAGWLEADWDERFGVDASGNGSFSGLVNATTYRISGTTVIDSSRNLTNIGTISSGAITSSGSLKATDYRVNEGNSLAGGLFKEKNVTGSGSSNDLTIFAESISNGGNIHFMTGGSAVIRATIDSSGNATFAGNIIAEDSEVHVGDTSGDNWTRIKHAQADGYGFDWQHNNATVIVNEQGSTNQVMVLGDVDAANYSGLFGVAHSTNSGTAWTKKLDLKGNGELYIGSSGTNQVYHEGHKPTYSELGTMAYSNLTGTPTITTLSNGANNRIVTAGGVSSINAEANLQYDGSALDIYTGSIAVTDNHVGLTFRQSGTYSDGRYEHRFRKRDEGGGIPLYIDKTSATANDHTAIARFGSYTSNPEEFQVYGKAKVTDLHIKSGTGGTNTQGLLFTLTDNADAQAYIKKTAYYMHYNAHYNEGHRFTVNGTDDMLRMHGSNNGTRPDSIDILAANGLYMNNTQVMTQARALTNVTTATAAAGTNTTALASTAFVQQEITSLVGGAPTALDTLNELAAAINDDSNYNTTLTTALGTKLPKSGGTMTGVLNMGSQNITNAGDIGMVTGHSSGKFAVMATSVHGSYDFYNNGTSYFNGTVTVDANLTLSGGGAILGSPNITAGRVVTSGLYGIGHGSSTLPIWQYNAGNPGYGIAYTEASPDVLRFDVSNNLMSGTADLELRPNDLRVNGSTVWNAGNDGSGSGLDADTVDGIHGGSFLRSDTADTGSGKITLTAAEGLEVFGIRGRAVGSQTGDFIQMYERVSIGYPSGWGAGGANSAPTQGLTTHGGAMFNTGNVSGAPLTFNGNTIWHAGNDGSGSGLDADTVDGWHASDFTHATASQTWSSIAAASTQAKRYHIARLYGCPAHWDSDWQNIELHVTAESYEAGTLKYKIHGNYGGAGTQANMIMMHLTEAYGDMIPRFRIILGSPVDAGWDHSGQDTYYVDVFAEASHYSNWKIHAKTFGHGVLSSNPSSGGAKTVFYSSPTASNISTFTETHTQSTIRLDTSNIQTQKAQTKLKAHSNGWEGGLALISQDGSDTFQIHPDNNGYMYVDKTWYFTSAPHVGSIGSPLWHPGNDGSGSGLDADTVDGVHASAFIQQNTGNLIDLFANQNGTNELRLDNNRQDLGNVPVSKVSGRNSVEVANMTFYRGTGGSSGFIRFQNKPTNAASLTDVFQVGDGATVGYGVDILAGGLRIGGNEVINSSRVMTIPQIKFGDGNDGYFYSDQNGRTAFRSGDFYIQDTVTNFYNYATNQYYGDNSGDNIHFRGNVLNGTGWSINGAGKLTTRDHLLNAGYHLQRSDHHSGHLEGSYNNIGDNALKSNPIYTIGSSYNPNDASLGNMYGIGYTNASSTFIGVTGAGGWGMYVAADGDARVWLDGSNGAISSTGQHYVGSNVVWNAGNDGAGSGLDADNLDGVTWATQTKGVAARNLTIEAGDGQGIGFWGGTGTVLGGSYAIAMASQGNGNAGRHSLDSSSDYNMYFKMSGGTDRGFVFKNSGNNVAAITSGGRFLGSAVYLDGSSSQNQYVAADSTHSLTIRNMGATGAGGLVLQGSSGTHGLQMYWDSDGAYYGFLDAAWANWDIQKARNGAFKVDEGSGLKRVLNEANWTSYITLPTDANTIDGRGFVNTGSNSAQNADTINSNGISYYTSGVSNFSGNATDGALYSQQYSTSWQHQIAGDYRSGQIAVRGKNNGTWTSWNKVWNAGNDGSGSGLDADLLDGMNSTRFMKATGTEYNSATNWSSGIFPLTSDNVLTWSTVHNSTSSWGDSPQATFSSAYTYGGVENVKLGSMQIQTYYPHSGSNGNGVYYRTGWESSGSSPYFHPWAKFYDTNNDGSGSGLDADLLDGQHGSYYLNAANFNGTAPTGSPFLSNFVHLGNASGAGYSTDDGSWGSRLNVSSSVHAKIEVSQQANSMRSHWYAHTGQDSIKFGTSSNHDVEFQRNGSTHLEIQSASVNATNGFTVSASNHTVWHAGNDGSGTGLDADLLDGQHGSYYYPASNPNGYTNDQTASELLTAIKTVDGSSSGLDADLLDGYHKQQISRYQSASNFVDGTLVTTNINSGNTNGDSFVIEISGKAYGSSRPHFVIAEGYIYNNTIINTNGSNIGGSNFTYLKVMNISGNLCFWWPRHGYWNSYDVFVRSSSAGTSNYNRVTAIANSADPSSATKKIQINLVTGWTSSTDGSGSGLDADLLDGVQGANYGRLDQSNVFGAGSHSNYFRRNNTTNYTNAPLLVESYGGSSTTTGVGFHISGSVGKYLYMDSGGNLYWDSSSGKVWRADNDGAGSGLDADLLDGQQGSFYRNASNIDAGTLPIARLPSPLNSSQAHAVTGSAFATTSSPGSVLEYQQASGQTDTRLAPSGDWYNTIRMGHGNPYNYYSNTIAMQMTGSGAGKIRTQLISNNSANGWRTIWDSTTDGSGSGLDADLLDGLDSSAFARLGGTNHARTIPNRWFATGDADNIIDYYEQNYAKAHMGNTYKYTNSRPNITSDSNYWIGSMGWGQIDLNTIMSYGSGFWDSWGTPANRPSTYTTHWNGLNSMHYAANNTYMHGMQMAMGAGNPAHTYLRGWWANGGSGYSWQKIWTDGNDGSGSGLDADLLDGLNSATNGNDIVLRTNSNGYLLISDWIDITSHGIYSSSTNGAHFYPNTAVAYGVWRSNGSRGGYSGLYHDYGGVVEGMYDSGGNGGAWNGTNGWQWYWHRSNACLAVGGSTTSSSYSLQVGGAIYASGNITAFSDRRVKENIIPIDNALEKVNALQGVYYNRIDDKDKTKEIGFIAQEVNEVAPELVTYAEDIDQYGVKYQNTTALLVEAVKELTQQVKDLKQEIEEIKNVK